MFLSMREQQEYMAKTELERLVAVETKMDTVIEGVKDLQHKFDQMLPTVVNHSQFSEFKESTAIELAELKKEFEKVKLKNSVTVAITGILSAVLGAIMAILVQSYFTK